MTSKTTDRFWGCYHRLPAEIQQMARTKYDLWRREPFHPSLHFKLLKDDVWSVRITLDYRALARRKADLIVWFWIGSHAEYDRVVG